MKRTIRKCENKGVAFEFYSLKSRISHKIEILLTEQIKNKNERENTQCVCEMEITEMFVIFSRFDVYIKRVE